MLNEAQYEQDWMVHGASPARPHMESNRWLNAICTTQAPQKRAAAESETIDLLGVKLVWVKDGNRPFPEPILKVAKDLLAFSELADGWNSYGGRSLQVSAGRAAIRLAVRGHQSAHVPRLHPLPDGGVGLTWGNDTTGLELLIAGNGTVEGLLSVDESETELQPGAPLSAGLELLERYLADR